MEVCPLSNKPCSRPKIFHITETVDGRSSGHNLCDDCAKQYLDGQSLISLAVPQNVLLPAEKEATAKSISPGLAALVNKLTKHKINVVKAQVVAPVRCPNCEHDLPNNSPPEKDPVSSSSAIQKLRKSMAEACEVENFERAAVCKTAIGRIDKVRQEIDSNLLIAKSVGSFGDPAMAEFCKNKDAELRQNLSAILAEYESLLA